SPSADPRCGVRGTPEGDESHDARAVCSLARTARSRPLRARRNRRVPPRAGRPLSHRARPALRRRRRAFAACRRATGRPRPTGIRARRHARGQEPARPGAALLSSEELPRQRLVPMLAEAIMEVGDFAAAESLLDETLASFQEEELQVYADA